MSKGKYAKKRAPFVDFYGVLLLIATLAMSIGYAEIVGTEITISTKAEATAQEGVFITDVICNEANSVSNNYMATTLDSSITLDSPTDTKSFTVKIYNKTVKPYVFVGVKKLDKWDEFTGVYNNTNISYTLEDKMVPHEYILPAKTWVVFNVDLGFNGEGTMPETLRSLLNFSFQEVPTLEVVSEDTIENMYPNCEEKVYEFTVSNQRQDATHGLITNGVPLTYTISPNVPAPLTAKIYDEDGIEVAGNKSITISSEAKEEHTYTMKVKWDNTNPVDGTPYNSASYAGQTLASSINVIATPDLVDGYDKYNGYTLNKAEPVEIKTEPLYFDVTTDKTIVEMNNTTNAENILLTIKNNNGTNTNIFETEYKINIDNSKFTLLVDEVELGENTIKLAGNSATTQTKEIQLVSKDGQELEATENCNLTIEAITPYAKTETIELTIKDSTGPTAPVIEGGSTGTYALTQTISVSEVSTDVGTGVGKYQYLLNDTESTETESIADVTTTATSQTFTEDAPGYYVYFRAVDNAGNPGEWSNAQQIYIDTKKPTVTPKQASVTITEGENYNLADYFTVVPNGTNTNYTVECTIDGTVYEITENIPVGEYTVICTATITGGNSATTMMTLKVESAGPNNPDITAYRAGEDTPYGTYKTITEAAVAADVGGIVRLGSGPYHFDSMQNITVEGITLEGAGVGTTIIQPSDNFQNSADTTALLTTSAEDITIKNLTLTGGNYGTSITDEDEFSVVVASSGSATFQNVKIAGTGYLLLQVGSNESTASVELQGGVIESGVESGCVVTVMNQDSSLMCDSWSVLYCIIQHMDNVSLVAEDNEFFEFYIPPGYMMYADYITNTVSCEYMCDWLSYVSSCSDFKTPFVSEKMWDYTGNYNEINKLVWYVIDALDIGNTEVWPAASGLLLLLETGYEACPNDSIEGWRNELAYAMSVVGG